MSQERRGSCWPAGPERRHRLVSHCDVLISIDHRYRSGAIENIPSFSQCTNHLQDQYTTANTTTTDLAALHTANTNIVINSKELSLNTSGTGLLRRHAEVEHITSVVHWNDQDTIFGGNTIYRRATDLFSGRGSKNGTSDRGITETVADEARKGGFVPGAAAGHDGDLVCSAGSIWAAEDNLVLLVQGQRRVCESEGVQGRDDQVVWVREEMFGWNGQTLWRRSGVDLGVGLNLLCIVDQKWFSTSELRLGCLNCLRIDIEIIESRRDITQGCIQVLYSCRVRFDSRSGGWVHANRLCRSQSGGLPRIP